MDEYINFANSIDISEDDDNSVAASYQSMCIKLEDDNEHLREVLEKCRIDNCNLRQNLNVLKKENEQMKLVIRTVEAITGRPIINNLE